MRLLYDTVLEDDSEMTFQIEGTGRRIVVTTMQLWVPKLMLTPEGQKRSILQNRRNGVT